MSNTCQRLRRAARLATRYRRELNELRCEHQLVQADLAGARSTLAALSREARSYTTAVQVWADETCMTLTLSGWTVVRTYSGRDYTTIEVRVRRMRQEAPYDRYRLRDEAPRWTVLADRIAGSLAEYGRRARITRREDPDDLDALIAVIAPPAKHEAAQ